MIQLNAISSFIYSIFYITGLMLPAQLSDKSAVARKKKHNAIDLYCMIFNISARGLWIECLLAVCRYGPVVTPSNNQ